MRGAVILASGLLAAGCGQVADAQAQLVANLRVRDAIADYQAAAKSGALLNQCVKARLVSAAYDDARDTADGRAWAARAQEDCRAAAATMGAVPPRGP